MEPLDGSWISELIEIESETPSASSAELEDVVLP